MQTWRVGDACSEVNQASTQANNRGLVVHFDYAKSVSYTHLTLPTTPYV